VKQQTEYITVQELEIRAKISSRTLRNWRNRRIGPPFIKVGKQILYKWADIEAWLNAHQVQTIAK
jgi:hypothetical protein